MATKNARPAFLFVIDVFQRFFFSLPTPSFFYFLLSVATVPDIALFFMKVEWKEDVDGRKKKYNNDITIRYKFGR